MPSARAAHRFRITSTWSRPSAADAGRISGPLDRQTLSAAVLREDRLWRDSTVLCWMLMPDHLHIVLRLGESEPLSSLMNRVKSLTSRAAGIPGSMPIWMRGFHDRALRRDEDLAVMIRYVGANPLRVGLVAPGEAYPCLGGTWMDGLESMEALGMEA